MSAEWCRDGAGYRGGVGAASVEQRCHLYLVAGDTRCAVHDAMLLVVVLVLFLFHSLRNFALLEYFIATMVLHRRSFFGGPRPEFLL
jgi:hypothetical protein